MAASSEIDNINQEVTYTFRFGTTGKLFHLTEQQLDCIPYLSLLVTHNNDFSSVQNEDGEYVLNSRIRYNWFMPILQAATTGHPSALFTELSQEAHVLGMLQLYDYLCVNPIDVPLLKGQNLVRTKPDNVDDKKFCVKYRRAKTRLKVRDTAAQFIIALTKNEYNLDDSNTLESIFSLIMIVLFNPNIFGARLCHHMLMVTKNMCFSLFSSAQQHELRKAGRLIQNIKIHSLIYLCDGHHKLPKYFENAFAWKGIYVPVKENSTANHQPTYSLKSTRSISRFEDIVQRGPYLHTENLNIVPDISPIVYMPRLLISPPSISSNRRMLFLIDQLISRLTFNRGSNTYGCEQERKKTEAKSARSGHFNTLPKRPKVDKFKHRCGPKAQKHR